MSVWRQYRIGLHSGFKDAQVPFLVVMWGQELHLQLLIGICPGALKDRCPGALKDIQGPARWTRS